MEDDMGTFPKYLFVQFPICTFIKSIGIVFVVSKILHNATVISPSLFNVCVVVNTAAPMNPSSVQINLNLKELWGKIYF